MTAAPHWILESNLILQAGAGTGKTHALVTLALHLLSGTTARRTAVLPSRLVALTFTEKAGAEMRERLQNRLAPLAEGKSLAREEPELAESLRWLTLPQPSTEQWRRIRRDLSLASIGTFHSFCGAQLRRLAPQAGIDPDFTMLDETEARDLFERKSEEHVLAALAAGDQGARLLVEEYTLSNERGTGTINLIRGVLDRLNEEGRLPDSLDDDDRFSDARAAAGFLRAADDVRQAAIALSALELKYLTKHAEPIAAYREAASVLTPQTAQAALERFAKIKPTLRKPPGDAGLPVEQLREAIDAFSIATTGLRTAPLGRAFVALARTVEEGYIAAKRQQSLLDFSDLQRLFRDLLRRDAATRKLVKSRFEGLLVDEFQDTSRIQLDLVSMLAETRAGEADLRAATDIAAAVRFEPGLLCIVGDRKQGIYEFRGADVAVFGAAERALLNPEQTNPPARIERLQTSRRSRPALVELSNTLFSRAMSSSVYPWEVGFTEGDALTANLKEEEPSAPLLELLEARGEDADEQRLDEALRIAARLDELIHGGEPRVLVRSRRPGEPEWRPVEGRDVALLFRRMTQLETYRDALNARGIAHVVVGGSGFYGTREVLDAWALLRVLDDPEDIVASVALLRSPWCSLRDDTVTRLALSGEGDTVKWTGVRIKRLLQQRPRLADPDEQARLDRLLECVEPLHREVDRLGAAGALALAIDRLDYLAVIATLPEADAIAANLEKLRRILARLASTTSTARGVIRILTERIRSWPREPEAPSAEESDPRSVRLMTIHQAKGLEFPVVFLVDCGSVDRAESFPVAYDRDLGLGVAIPAEVDDTLPGPGMKEVRDRLRARSQAELLRLLYVAVTRARDYVVISGARRKHSWFNLLQELPAHLTKVVEVDPERPRLSSPAAPSTAPRAPPVSISRLPIRRIFTTVTRLRDFKECPERYRLKHEAGLDEPQVHRRPSDSTHDAASLGSLAHRMLELADFEALDEGVLDGILRAEGVDPSRPEIVEMRSFVRSFLAGPLAGELRALPAGRRLREIAFQLAFDLGEGRRLDLKGQIDALALSAEAARVLDYKLASAEDAEPQLHAFQLTTYGLATREMLENAPLPIEIGVVPLRTPGATTKWMRLTPQALQEQQEHIRTLGRALVEALATGRWHRLPIAACRDLRCGFIPRCHVRGPTE